MAARGTVWNFAKAAKFGPVPGLRIIPIPDETCAARSTAMRAVVRHCVVDGCAPFQASVNRAVSSVG